MNSIAVMTTKNAESRQQEYRREKSDDQPISLLKFLQTENCKLRSSVSRLETDIKVLREAVRKMR